MSPVSIAAHSGVSSPNANPAPHANSTAATKNAVACGNGTCICSMVCSSTPNWAFTKSLVPPEIQKKMPIRTRAAVTGIHSAARSIVNAHWIMCVTQEPPGLGLTVLEAGALSDLDNIAVRIADVAQRLAVLVPRLRNELGPSTFP